MKAQSNESDAKNNLEAFKCINNAQAIQFCTNKKCNQTSSYVCNAVSCDCHKNHHLCLKANIDAVLQVIEFKITTTLQIKDQIDKIIDKAIDQLSKLRDKLLIDVDTKIKYSQLTSLQKSFLQISQNKSKLQTLNGKDLEILWKIISEKSYEKQKIYNKTKESVKKISETSNQLTKTAINEITGLIKKYEKQNQQTQAYRLQVIKQKQIKKRIQNIELQILAYKSTIITTLQESHRLIGLLNNNINTIKRVFVASESDFNIAKYYEICEKLTHTIIICRTNKDKIIGGYTPFQFDPSKGTGYVKDPKFQTFLFSITNNDKFPLLEQAYSIYRLSDKSKIEIGSHQFEIGDKVNINATGRTDVGNSRFRVKNYYPGDKQAYLRFNGNQGNTFTIKQWQVWQVQFDN